METIKTVAQIYNDVSERCGIKTKLPRSKSAELFRRLAAMFNKYGWIDPETYLASQFFRSPGKHLNVAIVCSEQGRVFYNLYLYVSVKHNMLTLWRRLRLDANFIKIQKGFCGVDSIRDLLLYRKPGSLTGNPESLSWIIDNTISPAFLSISRSYKDAYRMMGEYGKCLPNPTELSKLRWFIRARKELWKYCKRNFGEECNF